MIKIGTKVSAGLKTNPLRIVRNGSDLDIALSPICVLSITDVAFSSYLLRIR